MDGRLKGGHDGTSHDGWDEFTQTENTLDKQKRSALQRSVFADFV